MNEHQKVSCFNHGTTSIHTFFKFTDGNLLLSDLFVGQKWKIMRYYDWSDFQFIKLPVKCQLRYQTGRKFTICI